MSTSSLQLPRGLEWAVQALAVLGGAALGYHFGARLSGMPLGVVTAVMTALFCSILADAALRRVSGRHG